MTPLRRCVPALLCLALAGCREHAATSGGPAVTSAAASGSSSAAPAATSAAGPPSGELAPAASFGAATPAAPLAGVALVESAPLAKLGFEPGGRLVAELARTPPARAWLTLATKAEPLLPRSQAAHFAIAELVAPGVVAPTALRALSVAELTRAADPPARARLEKLARVLGDGKVEAALTLAPASTLTRVDLTNLLEDRPVWEWEQKLGSREPVPQALEISLTAYQSLLVADHLSGNLARRWVHLQPKTGRITAAEDNQAFTAVGRDGAMGDALVRLTRHMMFSKKLLERLRRVDRQSAERALRFGDPPTLLVTPKQVEEVVERARSVQRVIEARVKQRGEPAALALP